MEITRKVKLLYGDQKVEKTLTFKEILKETAEVMMVENHYSKKWNVNFGKINVGVFEDKKLLGAAVYGSMMNPMAYKNFNSEFLQESIIELNRLWVDDYLGKNTESILLSASFKIIKNNHPEIKAIQSFADGRLGCGTIYKATNFDYYGYSERMFYENKKTKEMYHSVSFENTKSIISYLKLNEQLANNEFIPFIVRSYRYVMPLYKDVEIEMEKLPYPEYDKGQHYINDFVIPIGQIMRAYILSYLIDGYISKIIKKYIDHNYGDEIIHKSFNEQIKNDVIVEYVKINNKTYRYEQFISYDATLDEEQAYDQLNIFDFGA